ncbi:hypothetical protein ACQ4LE_000722 [Meloidogyne hapla]
MPVIHGYRYDHIDNRGNFIDSSGRRLVFVKPPKPLSPEAKQFWIGFWIGGIICAIISYNLTENLIEDKSDPNQTLLLTFLGGVFGGLIVGSFFMVIYKARHGTLFYSEETKAGELFILGFGIGFVVFAIIFGTAARKLSPYLEDYFEDKKDLDDLPTHACIIGGIAGGLLLGTLFCFCQKAGER